MPILTVIKLRRSLPGSKLFAHASVFISQEYADYTTNWWKKVIQVFLKIFYGLHVVPAQASVLDNLDLIGLESSLFSITEDSNASKEKYPEVYRSVERLALGSKDMVAMLQGEHDSKSNVYIFNGRTASSYLVTKHCVSNGLGIFYYEYAAHSNGFRLFPVAPHASGQLGELMLQYFRFGAYNIAQVCAAATLVRQRKLNSDFAKTNKVKPTVKYDVVIFLGSDYEYTSVDPEICGVHWYGNVDVCRRAVEKYGELRSYAIRCHPNSARDPNWPKLFSQLEESLERYSCSVEIIAPDIAIDSHQLILDSEIVVTDLSTISLDAIMLGKRVDIFGNTDIRHIYSSDWMETYSNGQMQHRIGEPFSLAHNFLVFRFSAIESIICRGLYYIQRSFYKFHNWRIYVASKSTP
ncbi:hypothetical protein N9P94_00185 [Pseudomonadales bacterium]|nr:hypothetical protein [Pseudomonadales bacterium]